MNPILKLKAPKNSSDIYFLISDTHGKAMHKPTWKALLSYARNFKKSSRKVIWLGDAIDCWYLMKKHDQFKTWKARPEGVEEFFIPKLDEEIEWMNERIDELQDVFSQVFIVEGNHDLRISEFSKSKFCPDSYKHYFNLSNLLQLEKRKIPFVEYNGFIDIGKNLTCTHGYAHGKSANAKHYYDAQRSIIFGHVHQASMLPFSSRGHSHMSISLPCATFTRADYARNMPNNHSQGFGQVILRPDNMFHYYPHLLWNDKLYLPNGTKI